MRCERGSAGRARPDSRNDANRPHRSHSSAKRREPAARVQPQPQPQPHRHNAEPGHVTGGQERPARERQRQRDRQERGQQERELAHLAPPAWSSCARRHAATYRVMGWSFGSSSARRPAGFRPLAAAPRTGRRAGQDQGRTALLRRRSRNRRCGQGASSPGVTLSGGQRGADGAEQRRARGGGVQAGLRRQRRGDLGDLLERDGRQLAMALPDEVQEPARLGRARGQPPGGFLRSRVRALASAAGVSGSGVALRIACRRPCARVRAGRRRTAARTAPTGARTGRRAGRCRRARPTASGPSRMPSTWR